MKKRNGNVAFWRYFLSLGGIMLLSSVAVMAQSSACPGWTNPANFTIGATGSGNTYRGWQGQMGDKTNCTPNALTGSTCVNWQNTVVAANQMANNTHPNTGGDCATFPLGPGGADWRSHTFTILDTNAQVNLSGSVRNRDKETGYNLAYVPTQYNEPPDTSGNPYTFFSKSIRVGHACGRYNSSSGLPNTSAVYYNMFVTPQNAMLFLYYACVIENGNHGASQDPVFMVRVMKRNAAGQWVQAEIVDTTGSNYPLAYFVASTPSATMGDNINGWHFRNQAQSGYYYGLYYKDWSKVALNLTSLMDQYVRIEVIVAGCSQMQHFSYAYICGECRPMQINVAGCPTGMTTDVATLSAPRGLLNYVWYASEYGASDPTMKMTYPDDDPMSTSYFTFRQLTPNVGTEADSAYIYRVQADDFRVLYRPNEAHILNIPASSNSPEGDSIAIKQTFRCKMRSALDPAKPFDSYLYANATNYKPTMDVDILSKCGGDVYLQNHSYVPGDADRVNLGATTWSFYHNEVAGGQADTVMQGDTTHIHFDAQTAQSVRVRTYAHVDPGTPECYSEDIYPIQPLQNPVGGFGISQRVLCDDDPTTLVDTTAGSTYRVWMFRGASDTSSMELTDSLVGVGETNRTVTRSFTHASEPIGMLVRNGLYWLNPENTLDTIWCENMIYDSVHVFLHPALLVVGDTIVCQGTLTDATVTAVGVDSCTYQWSTSLNSITGGIQPGNHLAVVPYADTSTYYVRVTSPQGCVAWDSIHAYLVSPRLSMSPADGRICPGDTVILVGSNANSYTWTASPNDPSLTGQDTAATVMVTPQQSTTYTLVGHGGSGDNICDATPLTTQVTVFPYPVPTVNINPGIVDSEDPVVMLRDESPYSVASTWVFDGGEIVEGREVTHTFEEATGVDSVYVTLKNVNELGCQTVYPFGIPVNLYTAWFPNIFTPGSEDVNSTFRLYTINRYEIFHIYIYNRRGELVFDSDDPEFEWDGTYKGSPCPQGTYVYICRFRKPGTFNLSEIYGSITLVR